jgi:DNA polymerase-3 subunit beta
MKLTIERNALDAAINRATRIVEKRSTIPILTHVMLQADGGRLSITATNLDQEVKTWAPADVGDPGATTLDAHRFAGIVSNLPKGAQITIASDGTTTAIKSGRSSYKLPSLPAEDFPQHSKEGGPRHAFELDAAQFMDLAGRIEFAISTEETRYYLNGIFMHTIEDGGQMMLRAVATDGHKLSRVEMPAPEGAAGMAGVIVPRVAVAEIKRLAKDATGPLAIEINSRRINVEVTGKPGNTSFSSKLIDGTYPDYTRVIPTANNLRAVIDRDAFAASAKRVSQIYSERGKAVKLAFTADQLEISSSTPTDGDATDVIDISYSGERLDIGFNATYLAEVLETFDSDTILVKLDGPGSPALFMEREGAAHIVVVMPVRV